METMKGKIISINISEKKGTVKKPIRAIALIEKNFGIVGDAHSGSDRQVSFIGWEEVKNWLKKKRATSDFRPPIETFGGRIPIFGIKYGDFAENITTEGIDWTKAKVGDQIIIGKTIRLEITQIGKECHFGCAIRKKIGDCLMPKQGIFAKVLIGDKIKIGDEIIIETSN